MDLNFLIFLINIYILLPGRTNGHCSESDIEFKTSRCVNLLKPADFKLDEVMRKNIHPWSKYELEAICRNKEDFETCYQLMMYECKEKRKETRAVLEYFHNTFDYLCNRGHETFFEVMPCLNRMGVNAAISRCTDYQNHSTGLCRHLERLVSCTGKWAENNCGAKSAQFTQTMLESGLTFVRDNILCQKQTENEYVCSLSNIERRIDHCASNLELSELDLATFIIDPVPDWSEQKLTIVCRNLDEFKACYKRIISKCDNKGKELTSQFHFIMNTLYFLCNKGRVPYVIHSKCLIQYPLSTVRSQCLIQGRMKVLAALNKLDACRDVSETIACAADAAQHACNANAKRFTKILYQQSLRSIWEKNNCSDQAFNSSGLGVPYDVTSTEKNFQGNKTRQGSSKKLSNGTIAGIVIGCVALIVVLVGLLLFVRKKREKAKPEQAIAMRSTTTSTTGVGGFVSHDPFRVPRDFNGLDDELVDPAPPSYEQAIRSNYSVSGQF